MLVDNRESGEARLKYVIPARSCAAGDDNGEDLVSVLPVAPPGLLIDRAFPSAYDVTRSTELVPPSALGTRTGLTGSSCHSPSMITRY